MMQNQTPDLVRIKSKHSLLARVTHWLNFPVLLIMLWSGALIYWANPAYWPHWPDALYTTLKLDQRLALGMAYHFTFMWVFILNGIVYVLYLATSGGWRHVLPSWANFREAPGVVLHDLGFSDSSLSPANSDGSQLNAAQRIAYSGVLLMGAGAVVTGFAIYKPIQLSFMKQLAGGYETARWLHYLIAVLFVVFIIVHVVQVVRAGWNHFRAMVTGYLVEDVAGEG